MTASLIGVLLWLVLANVLAMLPSRDNHWRRAYILIAIGIPLLIWLAMDHGIWVVCLVLLAATSILRWPLRYGLAWIRSKLTK